MKRGRKRGGSPRPQELRPPAREARLRIIGGRFRGRTLQYLGDPRTRPMKDRVREAVFNLLGDAVRGKRAIDLFAGTGALGLEAISRGATSAVFVEQHFPSAGCIEQNVASLGLQDCCQVIAGDTFVWARRIRDGIPLRDLPWLVLCSPPYAFYVSRQEAIHELLGTLRDHAPADSLFVLESDARFDIRVLQGFGAWDVREYPPAVVGIAELPERRPTTQDPPRIA